MNLPFLHLSLNMHPDQISLVMGAFAIFMTLCSALYAYGYGALAKKSQARCFWMGLWSFGVFSFLTVLAADWFSLIIFLELCSISLFLMILAGDVKTAVMYLLTQFAGAGSLLIGVSILIRDSGTIALGPVCPSAFPFFLVGLGLKAALPVMHFWLPRTHSMAPTPASVLLSGFAVKMGVYGLIRLSSESTAPLFLYLGLTMAIYGVIQALLQHDMKRLLAFHTFSQLGFVMSALGSGTEAGIMAALFYSLAHGIFKGLLFCSAGVMEKKYDTRDLGLLGRGIRKDPVTFALFLVGALAITGFPGTSGFLAKSLVKETLKEGHHVLAIQALFLAGIGTALSFSKMAFYGFMKTRPFSGKDMEKEERPREMKYCHAAMLILALGTLALGILPFSLPRSFPMDTRIWLSWGNLLSALSPIAAGILFFTFLPGLFRPLSIDVPDLYWLFSQLERPFNLLSSILQQYHNGRLPRYLKFLLAAILIIFLLLIRSDQ